MARVKVKQLEPGKQLSEDVLGPNGRLLLKAGITIEAKHLAIFRTWGVVEVDIVGDDDNQDVPDIDFDTLPDSMKIKIYQRLKLQFSHCDVKHPLLKELITYRKTALAKALVNDDGKMV